jgi:hypothetical protein
MISEWENTCGFEIWQLEASSVKWDLCYDKLTGHPYFFKHKEDVINKRNTLYKIYGDLYKFKIVKIIKKEVFD